jgi:hypothetical protein
VPDIRALVMTMPRPQRCQIPGESHQLVAHGQVVGKRPTEGVGDVHVRTAPDQVVHLAHGGSGTHPFLERVGPADGTAERDELFEGEDPVHDAAVEHHQFAKVLSRRAQHEIGTVGLQDLGGHEAPLVLGDVDTEPQARFDGLGLHGHTCIGGAC